VGRGGVLEPFPGVGGFNWRISRINVGGLNGSLAVVRARFSWDVFILVRPCAAKGVQDRDRVGGGSSWLLCCRSNAIIGCARDEIHMVKATWALTMKVTMVGSHWLWFQTPLAILLLARPPNW
jgi:hypothetical protein